jgi:exopolysaccharide biosynthesis predicted pyruvyltransferase EpsI
MLFPYPYKPNIGDAYHSYTEKERISSRSKEKLCEDHSIEEYDTQKVRDTKGESPM